MNAGIAMKTNSFRYSKRWKLSKLFAKKTFEHSCDICGKTFHQKYNKTRRIVRSVKSRCQETILENSMRRNVLDIPLIIIFQN